MRIAPWSLLVLMFAASTDAGAQTAPNPAMRAACQGDVQRLCPGIQPGGGRIGECLKAHLQQISPQCLQAIKAARQAKGQGGAPR